MDVQFKTTVKSNECEVNNLKEALNVESEINASICDCEVEWALEVDARDWGVKEISCTVSRVTTEIEWNSVLDDDSDKLKLTEIGGKFNRHGDIEGTITVDSDQEWNGKKWTIDGNIDHVDNGLPISVDVDFEDMIITVL